MTELHDPVIGSPFNQGLLVAVYGIKWSQSLTGFTGLDFDEEQQFCLTRDDVDFSTPRPAVVAGEDFATLAAQPTDGHTFTVATDPSCVARCAISFSQAAG